jgi:hypothetical protein
MASDQPGYGSYLHMAVVRDGPILMLLNVWEFLGSEGAQPHVADSDVGTIATTAIARLPYTAVDGQPGLADRPCSPYRRELGAVRASITLKDAGAASAAQSYGRND